MAYFKVLLPAYGRKDEDKTIKMSFRTVCIADEMITGATHNTSHNNNDFS
jgi:hypothetical protein